jgi:hypothetical protein
MEVSCEFHVPSALPPRGKNPVSIGVGSWVILRARLDAVLLAKRRNILPVPGMELRSSSLVALLSYPVPHKDNKYES